MYIIWKISSVVSIETITVPKFLETIGHKKANSKKKIESETILLSESFWIGPLFVVPSIFSKDLQERSERWTAAALRNLAE